MSPVIAQQLRALESLWQNSHEDTKAQSLERSGQPACRLVRRLVHRSEAKEEP